MKKADRKDEDVLTEWLDRFVSDDYFHYKTEGHDASNVKAASKRRSLDDLLKEAEENARRYEMDETMRLPFYIESIKRLPVNVLYRGERLKEKDIGFIMSVAGLQYEKQKKVQYSDLAGALLYRVAADRTYSEENLRKALRLLSRVPGELRWISHTDYEEGKTDAALSGSDQKDEKPTEWKRGRISLDELTETADAEMKAPAFRRIGIQKYLKQMEAKTGADITETAGRLLEEADLLSSNANLDYILRNIESKLSDRTVDEIRTSIFIDEITEPDQEPPKDIDEQVMYDMLTIMLLVPYVTEE